MLNTTVIEEGLSLLYKQANALYPISEEDWIRFAAIWVPFEARRKELLTAQGETENFLYFTLEGVQRMYFKKEEGVEATLAFTYKGFFSGVIDSFFLQAPSKYFLVPLSKSLFLRTSYHQLATLMDEKQPIERMFRIGLSRAFSGVIERQVELHCLSAEEKFRIFTKRSPHLLQLVPHKYIASYLGIDATNFSKLMGKIRI